MRTERWFKVLVLGGAALGVGCGSPDDDEPQAEQRGAGGHAGAGIGDGGTTSTAGSAGGGMGGTTTLECSMPDALPSDPCGCPCCWATGCLNSEACCSGFCPAGNDGAGCCA